MSKFQITSHDDYHDIQPREGWITFELGCFPQRGYDYFLYFALHYTGSIPLPDSVMERLKPKLRLCITKSPADREDIRIMSIDDVFYDVDRTLSEQGDT